MICQGDIYWIDLGQPIRFRTSLSQIFTVDKALLTEKIGRLDLQRVRQILAGLALITAPAVIDEYP
jgi:hypothetical protein